LPLKALQVSAVQALLSLQILGLPAWQTPRRHCSPTVQGWMSLQSLPSNHWTAHRLSTQLTAEQVVALMQSAVDWHGAPQPGIAV
jgi:hypothetical protein